MPGNGRNGTRQMKIAGERNGEAAGQKDGQGRERGTGGVTTSVGSQERARPGSVAGREAGKMLQVQEARGAGRGEGEERGGRGKRGEEMAGKSGETRSGAIPARSREPASPCTAAGGSRPGPEKQGKPRPAAVLISGGSRNRSRKPLRRRLYRGGYLTFLGS